MSLLLEKVRVVELTQALAGPFCGMMLGDFGAEVLKVERPRVGDQTRGWVPPSVGTESAYFLAANRNKRSLTLNLDHPEALEILHRLLASADVFLVNLPSQASLAKRRLDYAYLAERNPRLIYVSITGYGVTGPKAGRPGYDLIAQGEAGIMSFTGEPGGEPVRYPVPLADMACGVYAAMGVLAALLAREQNGQGQFLDMALVDSQMTWLSHIASNYLNAGQLPRRWGNAHPSIVPYQSFRGSDHRHFLVSVGTEALWARFCRVLGVSETLEHDPRFATNTERARNRGELIPRLEEILATRPAGEWLESFHAAEIPAGPIQDVAEALNDPQTRAREMVVELEHPTAGPVRSVGNPVRLSATPPTYRRPPPRLGEHTVEVLSALGRSPEDIRRLEAEGAV